MRVGEHPEPMSAIATIASVLDCAREKRSAPATPASMRIETVRLGPILSSAVPTINCAIANAANQAAEIYPKSDAERCSSAESSGAITARNER